MKKLLLLTMISSLVVFLTACGKGSGSKNLDSGRFNDSIAKTEESIEGKNAPSPDTTTNQSLISTTQDTTTPKVTTKTPVVTTRPDGRSCFTVLAETKISYRTCGENIAAGQTTPQEVVKGWMNSEGHRKNILNGSFTKLGVGYVKASTGYKYYWTQMFIG